MARTVKSPSATSRARTQAIMPTLLRHDHESGSASPAASRSAASAPLHHPAHDEEEDEHATDQGRDHVGRVRPIGARVKRSPGPRGMRDGRSA